MTIYVVGPIVYVGFVVGADEFGVGVVSCKQSVLGVTRFVVGVDRGSRGGIDSFGARLGEAPDVFVGRATGEVCRGLLVKPMGFLGTARFRRNLGRIGRGSGPLILNRGWLGNGLGLLWFEGYREGFEFVGQCLCR